MDYNWPKNLEELAAEAGAWVAEATSDLFQTDDGWLVGYSDEFTPVSYTHLTLPTIYSV